MYADWKLTSSYCMIVVVDKGIVRAREKSEVRAKVRHMLTWETLLAGREAVQQTRGSGSLLWKGLTLSYLSALSSLRFVGVGNGLVHSELCLTREGVAFCKGPIFPCRVRPKEGKQSGSLFYSECRKQIIRE